MEKDKLGKKEVEQTLKDQELADVAGGCGYSHDPFRTPLPSDNSNSSRLKYYGNIDSRTD